MPSTSQHRVAFLMLTYNQANLVRQSAQACLAQQCEPLDIIFSDDASTDGTFDVLQEIARDYAGPHHLIVRRNERNLGIGEHFNTLIAGYDNELFIASAGDDISLPNRASALIDAWNGSQQKADLISSHCYQMSYDGHVGKEVRTDALDGLTPLQWLEKRPYIIGATHAFTRRMHLRFGPFAPDLVGEDQIMVFRSLCMGGAITLDQALVCYRDGGVSRRPDQMSPAENLAWIKKINRVEVAELRQLIRDAHLAGLGAAAERQFGAKLNQAVFLSEVLAETRFLPMLGIAMRHRAVPLLWRYKKAFTTYFHEPYAVFQRHNHKRRQFMRRLRGR